MELRYDPLAIDATSAALLRCSKCGRLASVLLVISRDDSLVAQINTAICRKCADRRRGH